jgi:F-type H+-transporting ATPase subunit b
MKHLGLKILTILAFIPNISLAESQGGGLPQMDVSSFPSQIFWLIITFGALYIFMWKNAIPKLRIQLKRDKIK